jgi:RNA polymerase sigma factor (sigma-70 family)
VSARSQRVTSTPAGWRFRSTRWTQVWKAGNLDTPSAEEALSELCRNYWPPLYAFVRRRGFSPEDSEDLTQAFFAQLLEKQYLQRALPERGRFRTFLLTSLDHFLCNEWDRRKSVKHGGRFFFVSLEELQAEERYQQEPFHDLTAEKLYDRRWVMILIKKTTEILRQEYTTAGDTAAFEALQGFLSGDPNPESYQEVAARMKLTVAAVKMRAHRLKRRFGTLLREQVADTVLDEKDIDEEISHLRAVWD